MIAKYQDLGRMQKLNQNDIHLLWHADFWDGPINGLCLWENRKYWFELIPDRNSDGDLAEVRRFWLVELSPVQLADEERWHELFRQKVGSHCDYGELQGEMKPAEKHREFYDANEKRSTPNYSNNPVIGWFELK